MLTPPYRHSLLLLLLPLLAATALPAKGKDKLRTNPGTPLASSHHRAVHALSRLTFGPRPGEVDQVERMGVDKWIEQQLHPERLADSLNARLAPYRTLHMSTRQMVEEFPPPPLVKAVMQGRLAMPSDPARRAIYEAQIARMRDKEEQQQAKPQNGPEPADESERDISEASRREQRRFASQRAQALLQLAPDERYQAILAMNPDERRLLAARIPAPERLRLVADMTPEQRETILAVGNPLAVVQSELMSAKLLRAIYSDRQLEEVMTDFWFNHFNVFLGKGPERYLVTSYERDVIRPHAMGKFKDLLRATAKSPAMLFYLDNWLSLGPDSEFARYGPERRRGPIYSPRARRRLILGGPPPRQARPLNPNAQKKQSGLNENYARELMELHTLGVNGGYTQHDVTEVARVFTGWTLQEPRRGGGFEFDQRKHEPGTKYVLGHKIKQHGEQEGEEVLNLLAHHPSTARFISAQLAKRFVSDDPPPALIDAMARTFMKKDGDIREVLRTMLHSPLFWSPEAYRARVKTPLEFVASAVRASAAEVQNPLPLIQSLNRMGMPLYGAQPPTGYRTAAETWVNSSALLDRMNFALALAGGKLPGITLGSAIAPVGSGAESADELVAQLEASLLAAEVSPQTHDAVVKQVNAIQSGSGQVLPAKVALITGLLLASPEFQRK